MTIQNVVEILFSPLRILQQNYVPFLGISFFELSIGIFIVGGLAIPLLKYILSMSTGTLYDEQPSNKKFRGKDRS